MSTYPIDILRKTIEADTVSSYEQEIKRPSIALSIV